MSLTPTTVGWVLVDGRDVDGATLAREEFSVGRHCGGLSAANTSAQAAEAVLRLQATVEAQGRLLHGVGVTWSGDAAAEAALLLESLTDAGFDNVVPVRFWQAAASLADRVDSITGSGQAAVCIVEPGLATVVMTDGSGASETAQHAIDGDEDLIDWLATLFARGSRRPAVLVVAGSGTALDVLAVRLGAELATPVFVQAEAQLALARGAALASGARAQFTPPQLEEVPIEPVVGLSRSRTLSYAGALTMLVAGVLTFVVSLSATLSLQLVPTKGRQPAEQVASASTRPSVARAAAPGIAPPPAESPRPPAEAPEPPAEVPGAMFDSLWDSPTAAVSPVMAPQPDGSRSLLNRMLQHIPRLRGH